MYIFTFYSFTEIDSEEAKDAILEGAIILVVLSNALEAIPEADFAIEFLRLCKGLSFAAGIYDKTFAM